MPSTEKRALEPTLNYRTGLGTFIWQLTAGVRIHVPLTLDEPPRDAERAIGKTSWSTIASEVSLRGSALAVWQHISILDDRIQHPVGGAHSRTNRRRTG